MGIYPNFESDVGHYFRNVYNIVDFVDRSDVDDKRFYTNLVRAQLSSQELLLLFYNCLSAMGQKFKPLIEKYALLKNMPEDDVIDQKHIGQYLPQAFGHFASDE